jgi:hypothetical protein
MKRITKISKPYGWASWINTAGSIAVYYEPHGIVEIDLGENRLTILFIWEGKQYKRQIRDCSYTQIGAARIAKRFVRDVVEGKVT